AAIFQHCDEGEQDEDLRQEDEHAADAFDDAVGKQTAERPGFEDAFEAFRGQFANRVDRFHQRLRQYENRFEHGEHYREEHQRSPYAMSENRVEAVGPGDGSNGGFFNSGSDDRPHPTVAGAGFDGRHREAGLGQSLSRRIEMLSQLGTGPPDEPLLAVAADVEQQSPRQERRDFVAEFLLERRDLLFELRREGRPARGRAAFRRFQKYLGQGVEADSFVRLHWHDGNAEFGTQFLAIDGDAMGFGRVHHVDGENDRFAEIEQLTGQIKVAIEVDGIDDGKDDIGTRFLGAAAEQQIDRDHLIRAAGGEAVRARQVDEIDS